MFLLRNIYFGGSLSPKMIATTTASAELSAAIGKRKIQILYRKNTENDI